jgi:hypothetical protein
LVEVDPVGLEPAQAPFDRRHDVAPRGAALQSGCIHRQSELRRDDDVGAAPSERVAEQFFGLARRRDRVAVGRIEERDAVGERSLHDDPRR